MSSNSQSNSGRQLASCCRREGLESKNYFSGLVAPVPMPQGAISQHHYLLSEYLRAKPLLPAASLVTATGRRAPGLFIAFLQPSVNDTFQG